MKQELEQLIEENICLSFARSGGPGGQNVNKVNTKVTARLPLACLAPCLGEGELTRLRTGLKNRLNKEGELIIQVQDSRSQGLNRERALLRIKQLIAKALQKKKKRRKTRATAASIEKRLERKKKHAEKKRRRRKLY